MDVQPAVAAPPPTSLQLLVDDIRAVIDGSDDTPPTAAAVSFVRGMIDKIRPDDVALVDEVRFFEETNGGAGHRNNPRIITCKTVYECSNFTITVFFLPRGAAMPLHNHPGLTVFSKLLVGSAHVAAYDWVRPPFVFASSGSAGSTMMLAEKVLDQEFTAASGAWVLFPDSGGNMHRFVDGEGGPCVFLDVVTPPYSGEAGALHLLPGLPLLRPPPGSDGGAEAPASMVTGDRRA